MQFNATTGGLLQQSRRRNTISTDQAIEATTTPTNTQSNSTDHIINLRKPTNDILYKSAYMMEVTTKEKESYTVLYSEIQILALTIVKSIGDDLTR